MKILSSILLVLVAACGGTTLDGGSTTSTAITIPGAPGSVTAAQVAAAKLACEAPHGPADRAEAEGIAERIVGAWYLCSGPNEFDFTSSLEFTAAGEMFLLVDDGNGGLGRRAGLDHQYAWSLNGKNAIFPGPMIPEFESAPRRMRIGMVGPYKNWYVPIE